MRPDSRERYPAPRQYPVLPRRPGAPEPGLGARGPARIAPVAVLPAVEIGRAHV